MLLANVQAVYKYGRRYDSLTVGKTKTGRENYQCQVKPAHLIRLNVPLHG